MNLAAAAALVAVVAAPAGAWSPSPGPGSPVSAAAYNEISAAISAKRAECGAPAWTPPVVAAGAPVRAATIQTLRSAVADLYSPPHFRPGSPGFSLPSPAPGDPIRAGYVAELRAGIDNARCAAACDLTRCTWQPSGCCVGTDGQQHLSLELSCPGQTGCPTNTRCDEAAACPPACAWTGWFEDGACGSGACGSPAKQPERKDCVDSQGRATQTQRRCAGACGGGGGCQGWSGWERAGDCGDRSCPANQRPETRSCTSDPGQTEERCVNDASCRPCGEWTAGECGAGGCGEMRRWTRDCPSGAESECRPDEACGAVECRTNSDCQNGCDDCGCMWRNDCVRGRCVLSDRQRPNPYCCFLAGTPIRTPGGDVAIETLRPGATVLAMDPASGRLVEASVVRLREGRSAERLDLTLEDGTRIETTPPHPFWDPRDRRFKPIKEFSPGDPVLALDASGKPRQVPVARAEISPWDRAVFTLTVSGPGGLSTYFANGVLVHNKCPRLSTCGGP